MAFWSGFKAALALVALLSPVEGVALAVGISAAVYGGLAFGIRRRSRVVAILALIVFIAERLLLGTAMAFPISLSWHWVSVVSEWRTRHACLSQIPAAAREHPDCRAKFSSIRQRTIKGEESRLT